MSQADVSEDRWIGQQVAGKYVVTRLIGSGGMGSVYEAENRAIGKRVALKFLHLTNDDTNHLRFQREARAISAVESAHIVQIFDWGQEGGQPYLVMELLDGRDLANRIEQLGRLPVADAVRYAIEALRGLRRVHAAGIVHRDLKPENLFLVNGEDDQLHVKIVDFGLSKLMDESSLADSGGFATSAKLTQAGAIIGTPLYMSPEQVEAIEEIDHRADIWAMGAILFEMLTGSPPFTDRSYARLVMAICQKDPPDLARINPEVSAPLQRAVMTALARDRERRFSSADAFMRALEALEGGGASGFTTSNTMPDSDGGESEGAAASRDPTLPSAGPLDATIAAPTKGAATVWLTDAPMFSIWRGEVDAPDRLRIETRDGSVRDLRLEPVGPLALGRVRQVGAEENDLVYPDVASRLAARLRHDGVRWWLQRRHECSVPVQVGTRGLARGEEAPLVHGTFITVGAMRATMVDRRYVSRSVPAGTVDQGSGLLARGGLEQEVATALSQREAQALFLALVPSGEGVPVRAAVAVHRRWPSAVVARHGDVVAAIVGESGGYAAVGQAMIAALRAANVEPLAVGYWELAGDAALAGSDVELALDAIEVAAGPGQRVAAGEVVPLRASHRRIRLSMPDEVLTRARQPKNQMLLFGIEEQAALTALGPKVVGALEQELAALIATQVGPSALVTRIADGVIGACVPRQHDPTQLGVAVQCEWHGKPPLTDGHVELPRTLAWEEVRADRADERGRELSRECADAQGVFSALAGGLPFPIAGRVYVAAAVSSAHESGAISAVERSGRLFDVVEASWRFLAIVLAAALFSQSPDAEVAAALRAFHQRIGPLAALPPSAWRELAGIAARGFASDDPIGKVAAQVLAIQPVDSPMFLELADLNRSARGELMSARGDEARAAADAAELEQITRLFLRALRPLAAWTLVSVQRTEPDLYGESQNVEFIDHTGPHASGARRRIGFNSPVRLANVVYLARWRDGLVLPLEPWVRRMASGDRFDLYWIEQLPRAGPCGFASVVGGARVATAVDDRLLPPLLRQLVSGEQSHG